MPKDTTAKKERLPVGFKQGNIIMILAEIYGTVIKVIGEITQNAIDAKARRLVVVLDLSERKLVSYDDGEGSSREEMRFRVSKIGANLKKKDDIGHRGIGNLAPIAIANKCSMITHKLHQQSPVPFFRVSFDRSMIEDRDEVFFDLADLPNFSFSIPGGPWTTSISVKEIEKTAIAALITSCSETPVIDFICSELSKEYGAKIKSTGIHITVNLVEESGGRNSMVVTPPEFPGRREVLDIETRAGRVTFDIFLTRMPVKRPQILVEHQKKFRFDLHTQEYIWPDVSGVFGSGHIQGIIKLDFCTLEADRSKGFVLSNDLQDFIDAVLKFAREYCKPWLDDLEADKTLDRFEKVGRAVVESADAVIRENPALMLAFRGDVSDGHVGSEKAPPAGNIRISTRRLKRDDGGPPFAKKPPVVPTGVGGKEKKPRAKEREVSHTGVSSPTGTRRRVIEGQTGIQIVSGEGVGWRIRMGTEPPVTGKIVVNISHPDWSKTEQIGGEAALEVYAKLLVMGLFSKLLMNDQRWNIFSEEFERTFLRFMPMLMKQKKRPDKK